MSSASWMPSTQIRHAGDSGGNIACVDRPAGGDLRFLGFGPGRHEFAGHALVVYVGSYRPVGVADGVVLAVAVAQHESWGANDTGADDAGRSILSTTPRRATTTGCRVCGCEGRSGRAGRTASGGVVAHRPET